MLAWSIEMEKFYNNGLPFACTQCSHCCCGESGYVFLSVEDLSRIVHFLQMEQSDFLENHARLVPYGSKLRLSLLEKIAPNGEHQCQFWDNGCSIYEARPSQCKSYPFWPSLLRSDIQWQKEALQCPGIGQGRVLVSAKEIEEFLEMDRNNLPIELEAADNFLGTPTKLQDDTCDDD
jgi:uncharacterized protein